MRLGTNMSAVISASYLARSESRLSLSLEKLSSGYKINHSKDAPAGMAISEKMRAQIKGLNRASMSAADGISVTETAEGALSEIEAILQRMNELAIQGSNETYTDEDRVNINNELAALKEEVNRIARDTDFNSTKLLNGDLQRRTYATSETGGSKQLMGDVNISYLTNDVKAGSYTLNIDATGNATLGAGFQGTAILHQEDNKIKITDNDGFQMEITMDESSTFSGDVTFEVWDIGTMPIQVGANEGQVMNICIPEISVETLNLDKADFTTSASCEKSISVIGEAISRISRIRSEIGAYSNRLEYTISSLDITQENMTAALSRISDTDMAEEMTNYTQQNVMQQAGISMVAQANQLPEKVLQLLN